MEAEVKVDMHCHSIYSNDGRHPIEEILVHARKIGLGGIVITDHNEVKGSLKAYNLAREMDIIVIRGMEVSSAEGHILAYGVEEVVPRQRSAAETIENVKKLGGVAVAAHPFRWQTGLSLESITGNKFAAFEARNGHSLSSTNNRIERMAREKGLGITGGSDSHSLKTIGKAYAVFDSSCESEDDFLEAIQKRKNAAGGNGRSTISSVGFAASCVWDWLKRGMKKI